VGYVVRGDSAILEASIGKAEVVLISARAGAGYAVGLSAKDEAGGLLLRGELNFDSEGVGLGELLEYAKGKPQGAASFRSDPDGRVLIDR
jgi:hypothetical protein